MKMNGARKTGSDDGRKPCLSNLVLASKPILDSQKCPKCGSEMREGSTVYYCMNPDCNVRWISKDGFSEEVYCGHEEKVEVEKR